MRYVRYARYARCRGTTQQSVANSISNAERKYYHANYLIASFRHFSTIFQRYKQRVVNRRKSL